MNKNEIQAMFSRADDATIRKYGGVMQGDHGRYYTFLYFIYMLLIIK
jgi:hypothetical protein